ncbi:unnamed protein product [Caenorhabditis nigoni]
MESKPMSFCNTQTVLTYMEPNFRFNLALEIPSIRKAEKAAPLHIDRLEIEDNVITVNGAKYTLSVIQNFFGMVKESKIDFDKYGLPLNTDAIVLPGDVRLGEQGESGPIDYDAEERKVERCLAQLEEKGDQEKIAFMKTDLLAFVCRRNNTLSPALCFIQLDTDEESSLFPYRIKIYEMMKKLLTVFFGNRKVKWRINHLTLTPNILRWPVDGLKPTVRNIEISGYTNFKMNALKSVVDEDTSFPLDSLIVRMHDDDTQRVNHKYANEAKMLILYPSYDFVFSQEALLSLQNPRVVFHDRFPCDAYDNVLATWMERGHPDPGHPDQGHPDQGLPDQGLPDPGLPDPGHPDPGHPDQGHPDPGHPDPGHPDPGPPDPGHPDQGHPYPAHPDPGHPDPGHPDPGHPDRGHPDPGHPDQGNPDPGHPGPGHPEPVHPDPGHPEPGHPDPGHPNRGPRDPRTQGPRSPGSRSPGSRSPGSRSPGSRSHGSRSPGSRSPGSRTQGPKDPGTQGPRDPGHPDPGLPDPGHPDPGHPDQGHPDPDHPDPGHPDPGHTDPGRPDQDHPDRGPRDPRTQGPRGPGHPDPGHPDPGHPDPGHPDPGHPDPGHPDPGHPDPEPRPSGSENPGHLDPCHPDPRPRDPCPGSPGSPSLEPREVLVVTNHRDTYVEFGRVRSISHIDMKVVSRYG